MKKIYKIIVIVLLLLPTLSFAQTGEGLEPPLSSPYVTSHTNTLSDINDVAKKAIGLGNLAIDILISISVLWIIVSIVRYLIAGGEDGRKAGGMAILYGVIGLFVILSIWGLVNILIYSFKFSDNRMPPINNIQVSIPSQFLK